MAAHLAQEARLRLILRTGDTGLDTNVRQTTFNLDQSHRSWFVKQCVYQQYEEHEQHR